MLCYKDVTHCPMYTKCKHGDRCKVAATPELLQEAADFKMGVMLYCSEPKCYENKNNGDKDEQ